MIENLRPMDNSLVHTTQTSLGAPQIKANPGGLFVVYSVLIVGGHIALFENFNPS